VIVSPRSGGRPEAERNSLLRLAGTRHHAGESGAVLHAAFTVAATGNDGGALVMVAILPGVRQRDVDMLDADHARLHVDAERIRAAVYVAWESIRVSKLSCVLSRHGELRQAQEGRLSVSVLMAVR